MLKGAPTAGLAVTNVSPDNLLVTVQGPTTQVEQALKVTINDYQRDDGSVFRSNDRDATVPGGLNIQAVSGLSTYDRAITHGLRPLSGTTPTQLCSWDERVLPGRLHGAGIVRDGRRL